jgi:hypothetical protein
MPAKHVEALLESETFMRLKSLKVTEECSQDAASGRWKSGHVRPRSFFAFEKAWERA